MEDYEVDENKLWYCTVCDVAPIEGKPILNKEKFYCCPKCKSPLSVVEKDEQEKSSKPSHNSSSKKDCLKSRLQNLPEMKLSDIKRLEGLNRK